jgi:hypothetical protein
MTAQDAIALYRAAKADPRRIARYRDLLKSAREEYKSEGQAVMVGRNGKRRGQAYQPLASRKSHELMERAA